LFHNDVVTVTFSNRITDTRLLPLVIGEVGDLAIDAFLGTKKVAACLSWCRIGVVRARILHRALRLVDLATHVTRVARLAAPWALASAPSLAEAKRVAPGGCGVDVALIVNVPCWVTSQVATVYVILHRLLTGPKEVAVLIHAICLVKKKPVAGPKRCKEITLEDTLLQVSRMDLFVTGRF